MNDIKIEFTTYKDSKWAETVSQRYRNKHVVGVLDRDTGEIEIIIDSLCKCVHKSNENLIKEISMVVVHELIHLLGNLRNERTVCLLEEIMFDD